MQEFVILAGLPGSGKSTVGRRLRDERKVFVISADRLRVALNAGVYPRESTGEYQKLEPVVWQMAELAVRQLLAAGENVAIDATNLTRERRAFWRDFARSVRPELRVVIRWCEGKWDSPARWATERGYTLDEYNDVRKKLEAMVQVPQPDEADEVLAG